jgi:D-amino-acid dehydrogenase
MDESYKDAITRLGDRIRVGGPVEVSAYSSELHSARLATLKHLPTDLFPRGGNPVEATFWNGLRSMTSDGPPVIGATCYVTLHLNTGHGTLAWTMACGSRRGGSDQQSICVDNRAGCAAACRISGKGHQHCIIFA